jgi:predicted O-methyltransferase YrrM
MQADIQDYLRLFRRGLYFEAHEALEDRWRATRSPVLQALIQIAAGCHHLTHGNVHGARTLWTKAGNYLDEAAGWPGEGIALPSLQEYLRGAIAQLPPGRRLDGPFPTQPRRAPDVPDSVPPVFERKTMNGQVSLVLQELEALKADRDNLWNVSWDTGQFLRILALSTKAKNILEIGMSNGFSTLWWASAARANGGTVTTCEMDPAKIAEASASFERAGLSDVIRIVPGDAHDTLPNLQGPWDIVFVDAWKGQDPVDYFHIIAPMVRAGGLVVADNATSHAEEMRPYLDTVRHAEGWESVLLPIGSGEEVSLKRA